MAAYHPVHGIDKTIRVVLADDHPVVREGLRNLLERAPDITVVAEAGDGQEALRLAEELTPDVLLLDIEMPGMTGVEVARRLRAAGSPVRVLALGAYDDELYIFGLLEAGAAGYLLKDEAIEAIVAAVRGGVAGGEEGFFSRRVAGKIVRRRQEGKESCPLTEREQEVLRLLAKGWSNARIAQELAISERTVRYHLQNIYNKIGVSTRGEAIVWAVREGFGER